MLAVRGGTIGCAWWHYYLCVVALLSVRGGTMKADLGVFRFFYLPGLARNCVLSFFVPVMGIKAKGTMMERGELKRVQKDSHCCPPVACDKLLNHSG